VQAANESRDHGNRAMEAIEQACRMRFRAVLMTSMATVVGLLPLAIGVGIGGETYVPMARAIIGGMLLSVGTGVFGVPALWYLVRRRQERHLVPSTPAEA
jgi:multidrug efflux pump subunit AcrB